MTDQVSGSDAGLPQHARGPRVRRKRRRTAPQRTPPQIGQIAMGAEGRPAPPRVPNPIVPPKTVARRTLLTLVAIMSFLACLSVAAVAVIAERAESWQRQIADEVTIQVAPAEGVDMEAAVARAVEVAMQVPGITAATPLDESDSTALLEPWLGSDFDASDLPIPRLIAVRIEAGADLSQLAERLQEEVPSAALDDHGQWLQRLSSMASVTTLLGSLILALVFAATALCVVFATQGAMASNRIVIEVLHFVGAEDSYVAREFQRHFLLLGLRGAGLGGAAAVLLFVGFTVFGRLEGSTPEEAQLRSLFGGMSVGWNAYAGAGITVLALAVIIALTARLTVRRTLTELD